MELYAAEYKSVGALRNPGASVRVFIDRDFRYGYFVDEHALFALLTPEQQTTYLQGASARLEVTPALAQQVIDLGMTPYAKQQVL